MLSPSLLFTVVTHDSTCWIPSHTVPVCLHSNSCPLAGVLQEEEKALPHRSNVLEGRRWIVVGA